MECKEETGWDVDTLTNMIKVEPYWNVKSNTSLLAFIALIIKVEPYWNVKYLLLLNCFKSDTIKVEPYWNVKLFTT